MFSRKDRHSEAPRRQERKRTDILDIEKDGQTKRFVVTQIKKMPKKRWWQRQ